ncbi:MAG TPA: M1 family aminopeptidase [Acidimicrobiales bacterium]|nr:M1 family aminopeptidase [Acidimicrobiales bacterium]
MSRRTAAALLVVAAVTSGACGGDDAAAPGTSTSSSTTSTTGPSTTAGPGPSSTTPAAPGTTAGRPTTSAAPATAAPAGAPPSCPSIPPRVAPRDDRSRYTLRIDVEPADNVVEGETVVRFTPDLNTDKLVFRLWANAPRTAAGGARLDVGGVSVGGRQVDAVTTDPTTVVARPGNLAAGHAVEVSVPWRLTLPGTVSDRISRTGDAIRLGSFYPVLAWEPGIGWAEQPASSGFAEATTTAAADFEATITVPSGFDVLATGTNEGGGRWTATGVPDFALSVGHFTLATGTANAPQPVRVTVGVHADIGDSPEVYLAKVVRALEDYGRRFGPYPWPAYTLAITPALSGGIEYPMHVLQGPGTNGRTTSHEVAHMWFYGLVENNQGRDPWLDEGLATYAEARVEGTLASMRSTSIPAAGRGHVGEPMTFWESRKSIYYRSVYIQGAQAVAALGDADLVDCALRVYVARHAYRVARPTDLVESAASVFPDAAAILARYGVHP